MIDSDDRSSAHVPNLGRDFDNLQIQAQAELQVMLRAGTRRYTTRVTPLLHRRLSSVASLAEEGENVRNVDKLLSAVR